GGGAEGAPVGPLGGVAGVDAGLAVAEVDVAPGLHAEQAGAGVDAGLAQVDVALGVDDGGAVGDEGGAELLGGAGGQLGLGADGVHLAAGLDGAEVDVVPGADDGDGAAVAAVAAV